MRAVLYEVYPFQTTRAPDGEEAENATVTGLMKEVGTLKATARTEVGRLAYTSKPPPVRYRTACLTRILPRSAQDLWDACVLTELAPNLAGEDEVVGTA